MDLTFKATFDTLDEKLEHMKKKIDYVQDTFSDTLHFTNKTHYMEELNIMKKQRAKMHERN